MKRRLVFLTACWILCYGCYKESDFLLQKIDIDEVIAITYSDSILYADGVSEIAVIVEIPTNATDEKSLVKIHSTTGTFENEKSSDEQKATLQVLENRDSKAAIFKLKAGLEVKNAIISVSVGELSLRDTLIMARAYPEYIMTNLPAFTISYGYTPVNIVTKLNRSIGFPSNNSIVNVYAESKSGMTLGQFLNFDSIANDKGIITHQYALGVDTCLCSSVYIISETANEKKEIIRDTAQFIIK